jgi:hypothetical protein
MNPRKDASRGPGEPRRLVSRWSPHAETPAKRESERASIPGASTSSPRTSGALLFLGLVSRGLLGLRLGNL